MIVDIPEMIIRQLRELAPEYLRGERKTPTLIAWVVQELTIAKCDRDEQAEQDAAGA